MLSERADDRRSRTARWLAVAIACACLVGCLSTWRSGLFNNRSDMPSALADHQAAWRERGYQDIIARDDLRRLMTSYDGECITQSGDWGWVDLRNHLDHLAASRTKIECFVDYISRWPQRFPNTTKWILVFEPLEGSRLRLTQIRRLNRFDGP